VSELENLGRYLGEPQVAEVQEARELLDRYRSRDQYVRRVRRATEHLAASGYITNPDRMALIAAAEREPLPEELRCRK